MFLLVSLRNVVGNRANWIPNVKTDDGIFCSRFYIVNYNSVEKTYYSQTYFNQLQLFFSIYSWIDNKKTKMEL